MFRIRELNNSHSIKRMHLVLKKDAFSVYPNLISGFSVTLYISVFALNALNCFLVI